MPWPRISKNSKMLSLHTCDRPTQSAAPTMRLRADPGAPLLLPASVLDFFCFFFLLCFDCCFSRAHFSNLRPPLPGPLIFSRTLKRAFVRPSFRPLCVSFSSPLLRAPRLRARFVLTNILILFPFCLLLSRAARASARRRSPPLALP